MTRVAVLLTIFAGGLGAATSASDARDAIRMLSTAPVHFEPAASGTSRFIARGFRYHFEFENNQAILRAGGSVARLRFDGAASSATVQGWHLLPSKTNTFVGRDSSQWRTDIPNYEQLQVRGLYRGIDLVYYGNSSQLEYDLHVKPGADPRQIRLTLAGDAPKLDAGGDLVANLIQKHPVAYQVDAGGARKEISSRYRRNSDGSYGFALGPYDHSRELVIDPVLSFSLYLSGSSTDTATSIAHDGAGRIYVGGTTFSTDLPISPDAYQATQGGGSDVFITIIDPAQPNGSQVIYSTFYGGTGTETLTDMVVSSGGIVYGTGSTNSDDLPLVNEAQATLGGGYDAFIFKLIPNQGTSGLYYSTFLGGLDNDTGNAIALDSAGKIYVVGDTQSSGFTITNGFQSGFAGFQDAFLAEIDTSQATTATLVYSTFIGGSANNTGQALALASDGTVWIAGGTNASDFPIAAYCYDYSAHSGGDAFLVQINPSKSGSASLLYGTYFGGNGYDEAKKIAIDSKGRLVFTGVTTSQDLPVSSNAYQTQYAGGTDVFLAVLDPSIQSSQRSAQLVYSTYFGGSLGEAPFDLKLDTKGNAYLSGFTISPDMPVTSNALQASYDYSLDGFIAEINPNQSGSAGLLYSTFLGSAGVQTANSLDLDASGNIWVTGFTTGGIFDALGGPANPQGGGKYDVFVMAFSPTPLAPPCTYQLSLGSYEFPEQGASQSISVTASASTCTWTASSSLSWVSVAPASGTGSGSVVVTTTPNTTGARQLGNITIAGISFLVGEDK